MFAGSAKLLFAKQPAGFEVLNDLNGEIINFFRVAKHRPAELAELLELEAIHAGRFRELRAATSKQCELQRALRFAYLVWYSFGAKGEHFASSSARNTKTKRALDRVRELLHATARRLCRVLIEQRDFMEILDRYDGPQTFFYLDPPYVEFQPNGRYEPLSAERRRDLFARLAKCQAKFLMSFDDCAEIRGLAREAGFKVKPVEVAYTISGPKRPPSKAKELLISNY